VNLVTAVIKPHKLDDVITALSDLGVAGMTITEVRGHGRQKGHTEIYRGAEYHELLLPKVRIDVLADDDAAERVATAITDAARTGEIGDGKVWISALKGVTRIRTGEKDHDAI